MTLPGAILDAIVASIAPASTSAAASASDLVVHSLTAEVIDPTPHSLGAGVLERLAGLMGGAQHASRPSAKQRFVVVVAGDHGCATPADTGPRHPTVVAAHTIASGSAALTRVARMSETSVVLVNAGAAESGQFPNSAISLVPRRELAHGPAIAPALPGRAALPMTLGNPRRGTRECGGRSMSLDEAYGALEAGVALSVSLSERDGNLRAPSLALIAVGAIGEGADVAAAALLNATAARPTLGTAAAALVAHSGSPQIGILAGLMLGAASMRIPVILDSYATGAAALVAAAIAPTITGYLIAAHSGSHSMSKILAHLGLVPLFKVGLGRGDGTGAAMIVPLADHVAALARDPELQ